MARNPGVSAAARRKLRSSLRSSRTCFSASISLIADYPCWESTSEHSLAVAASAAAVTVKNSCGISFAIAPEQSCPAYYVDENRWTVCMSV